MLAGSVPPTMPTCAGIHANHGQGVSEASTSRGHQPASSSPVAGMHQPATRSVGGTQCARLGSSAGATPQLVQSDLPAGSAPVPLQSQGELGHHASSLVSSWHSTGRGSSAARSKLGDSGSDVGNASRQARGCSQTSSCGLSRSSEPLLQDSSSVSLGSGVARLSSLPSEPPSSSSSSGGGSLEPAHTGDGSALTNAHTGSRMDEDSLLCSSASSAFGRTASAAASPVVVPAAPAAGKQPWTFTSTTTGRRQAPRPLPAFCAPQAQPGTSFRPPLGPAAPASSLLGPALGQAAAVAPIAPVSQPLGPSLLHPVASMPDAPAGLGAAASSDGGREVGAASHARTASLPAEQHGWQGANQLQQQLDR